MVCLRCVDRGVGLSLASDPSTGQWVRRMTAAGLDLKSCLGGRLYFLVNALPICGFHDEALFLPRSQSPQSVEGYPRVSAVMPGSPGEAH